MPVIMRSFEIAPGPGYMTEDQIPDDLPWPQNVNYIVGIADRSIGVSPHQSIALPDGRTMTMPGHQAVLSCLNTPETPTLGVGYSVVPGPEGNEHNMRIDPMPEGSLIGAPLVNSIRLGPTWLPLTSHRVIEYGLHKGILRLRFFGANPTAWATPDWSDGYPFMPEMVETCDEPARVARAFLLPPKPAGRSASAPAAAATGVDEQIAVCAACHGRDGIAGNPGYPNLAGQKTAYLRNQLVAFRDGRREDPLMSPSSRDLTDEQIDRLAEYYSAQPLPIPVKGDGDDDALDPASRPLVYCVRCHGIDGISPNDIWPSLAGQNLAYLKLQMEKFGNGERQDAMMSMWSGMVDAEQMDRILAHFSRLGRPVPASADAGSGE